MPIPRSVVFAGWWVAIFRALLRFIEAQNSSPYFCAPMTGATREPEWTEPPARAWRHLVHIPAPSQTKRGGQSPWDAASG
jgi:hypothetical protein